MSAVSNALPLVSQILRLTHLFPPGKYNATTFEGAGHWTQVVWKHSRNLGCAAYSCPQGTLGKKEGDKWKCACWVVEMQRPCDDAYASQPFGTTSATTIPR